MKQIELNAVLRATARRNGLNEQWLNKWVKDVIVDDTCSLQNPEHSMLIGNSRATIEYSEDSLSTIYIMDRSEADITVRDKAFVLIHVYDMAKVSIDLQDKGNATVVLHSNSCEVNTEDCIKIRYKNWF